jgi:hypothetical protein
MVIDDVTTVTSSAVESGPGTYVTVSITACSGWLLRTNWTVTAVPCATKMVDSFRTAAPVTRTPACVGLDTDNGMTVGADTANDRCALKV